MARPLRIQFPGAIYHITTRGNEKRPIFFEERDYLKLIEILSEAKTKYLIKIYSYVLMPNHYHLLMETSEKNLCAAMHFIQTKYASYVNNAYNRTGHLFQGRYKSIVVDKESYLAELVRYIHLNPVRAGLTSDPEKYRWSSYNEYMHRAIIADTDLLLNIFSCDKRIFRKFTLDGLAKKREDIFGNVYGQIVLGTKCFTDKIKYMIDKVKLSEEIPYRTKVCKRISKELILDVVMEQFHLPMERLLYGRNRWNEPRKICIYLLRNLTDMTLKEISNLFGNVHYSAISRLAKKIHLMRLKDHKLNELLGKLESKVKT
jgi:REP element-mobilizing transposase RayT